MGTEGSGATRSGAEDSGNEDAYLVEEGLGLYVVCDGMGRGPAGEVASRLAVEALEDFVGRAEREISGALQRELASRRFAGRAIRYAMAAVVKAAQSEPELSGMATTVTALLAHGRRGVLGHVGDSRAYLIRDAVIHQLTLDHDLTAGFESGGTDRWGDTWVNTFSIDLEPGDTYLLCTDGAEQVVDDPELVRFAHAMSPRVLANRIVMDAHCNNPLQDATAIAIRVRSELEPSWLWLSSVPQTTTFGHALGATA